MAGSVISHHEFRKVSTAAGIAEIAPRYPIDVKTYADVVHYAADVVSPVAWHVPTGGEIHSSAVLGSGDGQVLISYRDEDEGFFHAHHRALVHKYNSPSHKHVIKITAGSTIAGKKAMSIVLGRMFDKLSEVNIAPTAWAETTDQRCTPVKQGFNRNVDSAIDQAQGFFSRLAAKATS